MLVASKTTIALRFLASVTIAATPSTLLRNLFPQLFGHAWVSKLSLEMSIDKIDSGKVFIAHPCLRGAAGHGPCSTVRDDANAGDGSAGQRFRKPGMTQPSRLRFSFAGERR
jgi:hypothetical protein